MRDLHRGNDLCLMRPSGIIATIDYENWRIYENRLMTWKLSLGVDTIGEIGRIPLMTLTTL